ncbi:MAG: glycosyltransferase [Candidatus Hodarchaeota archaeon]
MSELGNSFPFVTVAVCTLGKAKTLEDTIKSLLSQSYPSDKYEIIVVVDESTRAYNRLKKYPIRLLFRKKIGGLSSARNLCVKHANGEIIAFTDDDCIADRFWLEELVKVFVSDDKTKGVGGIVRSLHSDAISKGITLLELVGVAWLHKEEISDMRRKRIAGINSAFQKSTVESIGGWDEKIAYGADDVDISHRLIKEGHKLKLTPKAVVYHNHRSSLREVFWWSHNLGMGYSYYIKKHKNYLRGFLILMPLLAILSIPAAMMITLIFFGIFTPIIVLGLSVLGYLGWIYYKSRIANIDLDLKSVVLIPIIALCFSIGGIIGRLKGFIKK